MPPHAIAIAAIMFVASFTQSATGFGVALVAMPLLVQIVGVRVAAPLVGILSAFIQIPVLIRYRAALDRRTVARLSAAVAVGVPFGVFALKRIDPDIVTTVLGMVLVGYSTYALIGPRLPVLRKPAWAYPFGLVSGLLSGAYSTGGPPLIIYGDFSRWEPAAFKGNLQAIFMVTTAVQVASHAAAGNLTPTVWNNMLPALPGVALGVIAGLALDRGIDAALFRKIVLALLIVLGLRLMLPGLRLLVASLPLM
jgi:hypothetical protein